MIFYRKYGYLFIGIIYGRWNFVCFCDRHCLFLDVCVLGIKYENFLFLSQPLWFFVLVGYRVFLKRMCLDSELDLTCFISLALDVLQNMDMNRFFVDLLIWTNSNWLLLCLSAVSIVFETWVLKNFDCTLETIFNLNLFSNFE